MISVEFELRDFEHPSRAEVLIRAFLFFPAYALFFLTLPPLFILYLANLLLILFLGRRNAQITKLTALAGSAHLARFLAYFWAATDDRPAMVPLEEAPKSDFRWRFHEHAHRSELFVRLLLVPIYIAVAALAAAAGTFIVLPLQTVFILVLERRQSDLEALAGWCARTCAQIYAYSFLVTDERPLLSAG